jgi:DNA-binding IclR family transcriptional regulator
MSKNRSGVVQTTETTLDIVDALLERDGATIGELTEDLNVAESTVYRHLSTLENRGYVLNEGDHYEVSLKFLTIGGYLRRQVPAYAMIKEKVDELAEQTGERAQFIVRERDNRVYLYTEAGEQPVQTGAYTGRRGPIYASAAGKAIIACLPERRREALIDAIDFEQPGPNTITDPDELRAELSEIDERGYAFNFEESTKGVHAVGAVVQANDEIIGALSVSGPATRLKGDRLNVELPEMVQSASNELELHLEHTWSRGNDLGI